MQHHKKKKTSATLDLNTKAAARPNPLPPHAKTSTVRPYLSGSRRKVLASQRSGRRLVSSETVTLAALRARASHRTRLRWKRARRGLLSPLRVRDTFRRRKREHRAHLRLQVAALPSTRLRVLRRTREKLLFHPRKRPSSLHPVVRRLVRRNYNSKFKHVSRYRIRVRPSPQTRRMIKERIRRVGALLRPRKWRFAQLQRAMRKAVPEQQTRLQLHRLVRHFSSALAQGFPVARAVRHYRRREKGLQDAGYTVRKTLGRLQYSVLYSKYTARALGQTRLVTIRRLRLDRQLSYRRLRAPRGYRTSAHRFDHFGRKLQPRRPQRRRWFLQRMAVPSQSYNSNRRGPRKPRPLLHQRAKLHYPRTVRRILRLQRANRRVKQQFKTRRVLSGTRPVQRFVYSLGECRYRTNLRVRYRKLVAVGAEVRHLLRRISRTASRPSKVREYLRSKKVQSLFKTFVQQYRGLFHYQRLYRWSAKRLILNFLSVSLALQRHRYITSAALRPPVYILSKRRSKVTWPRSWVRRARYFALQRARARLVKYSHQRGIPLLLSNESSYYSPRFQTNRKISAEKLALLAKREKVTFLWQSSFLRGVRRARLGQSLLTSRARVRLLPPQFGRARAVFQLYADSRLVYRGRKRRCRFSRRRRVVRVYQHRRVLVSRKITRALRRARRYRFALYRAKQRVAPARLLKVARSGHLALVSRRVALYRWKRLSHAARRSVARACRLRRRRRTLLKRSSRRRKPYRRWRNKRFKGRWGNFRRPAWLVKQNAPRRLKLRKTFPALPSRKLLKMRLNWLLGGSSRNTVNHLPRRKPANVSILPLTKGTKIHSPSPATFPLRQNVTVTSPALSSSDSEQHLRSLWAKIFSTKPHRPPAAGNAGSRSLEDKSENNAPSNRPHSPGRRS